MGRRHVDAMTGQLVAPMSRRAILKVAFAGLLGGTGLQTLLGRAGAESEYRNRSGGGSARASIHWPLDSDLRAWNDPAQGQGIRPLSSAHTLRPVSPGSTRYELGRVNHGLSIFPASLKWDSHGYRANFNPGITSSGFTWMAYVKTNRLSPAGPQSILWHQGTDAEGKHIAGISIFINSSGHVKVSIGQGGRWAQHLFSRRVVGANAWHHVALSWNGHQYSLFLNGVLEDKKALGVPPDWSAHVPTMFGSYHNGRTSRYTLDGALDEIKFIHAGYSAAELRCADMTLGFRHTLLADMKKRGVIGPADDDVFNTPSYKATSILRAYIASLYSSTWMKYINNSWVPPQDPFPFTTGYQHSTFNTESGAHGGLYTRIRDRRYQGMCGSAAMILWSAYRAFGYDARKYDWMAAGTEVYYPTSHVLTEVLINETGAYCMQDPTYNISGWVPQDSAYYGLMQIPAVGDRYRARQYTALPFSDGGYVFTKAPAWTATAENYFSFFQTISSVLSGYNT